MSLGRITVALHSQHLSFINTRWLTKIYVLIDIACIFSQFIGALMPVSGDPDSAKKGQIILIAGLITQLSALSLFVFMSWHIYQRIKENKGKFLDSSSITWRRYFRVIEIVTCIMIVRSLVRSIEFLQGQGGYVISHETFIYVFDASLMFLIMVIFLVVHPGRLVRKRRDRIEGQRSNEHIRLQSWST